MAASLRSLEAAQLVLRRDLSKSVVRVEYELAHAMREPLGALLDHLSDWGAQHGSRSLGNQASLGSAAPGAMVTIRCNHFCFAPQQPGQGAEQIAFESY